MAKVLRCSWPEEFLAEGAVGRQSRGPMGPNADGARRLQPLGATGLWADDPVANRCPELGVPPAPGSRGDGFPVPAGRGSGLGPTRRNLGTLKSTSTGEF